MKALKSTLKQSGSDLPLRVLVVEDNVICRSVATKMLETLGTHADVAANGREALEMLKVTPYQVVFLDCRMPGMDGYEAAQEIRRREGPNRSVAIIALTAEALAGCRERCLEAGMDDFIAKPVRLNDLTKVLKKWTVVVDRAEKVPAEN